MRLLIHMGDSYPDESPSAKRMRTFYEAFKESGHEVCVLAPENGGVEFQDVIRYKAIPLTSKSSLNRLLNQLSIGLNSVKAAKAFGKAGVVLTTSPPALISIFGWLIAKKNKAKLIYDVRDIWPDVAWEMGSFSKTSIYSRLFAWNRNFMLKHADMVSAVSRGKVEKLRNYQPKADVIYITNGLDEKFLENTERPELAEEYQLDDHFTCVYVGNLGLAQGLMQLLQVAKRAKDADLPVRFLIFGSGVEGEQLRKFANENELDNVQFPGRLANSDMYTILKHAGMSFVSLVNEKLTDSVPTKLFEALGVGCPVLLAASGESTEILKMCDLGMSVIPNDEEALWQAFLSMYENRDEYASKKENAREVILKEYSRQQAAKQMVYEVESRFQVKPQV